MWIFREADADDRGGCPKCGFCHYPAVFVFGRAAYHLETTQQPWMEKQLNHRRTELEREVAEIRRDREKDRAGRITGLRTPAPRKRRTTNAQNKTN